MGRLIKKISNHVSPYVHQKVEDMVYNPDRKSEIDRDDAYLLSSMLFNDSDAYTQNSYFVSVFADKIKAGDYEHISSVDDARDFWNDWLDALHDFLKNIKVTAKKKIKKANKEKMISDSYSIAKDLINSLSILPRTTLIEQMAQDIERGDFDDISSLEDARKHWKDWIKRARQILKSRNIILDYR